MLVQRGYVWSSKALGPCDSNYTVMWLDTGAVYCNIFCLDEANLVTSKEDFEQADANQAVSAILSSRQCTAMWHKKWETPLDLSVHEDSAEKVFKESYVKALITKSKRQKLDSECCICDFIADTECQLSLHIKQIHPQERLYRCTKCSKAFNTYNDRDSHYYVVHRTKSVLCNLCDYTTANEYKIAKHIMIHSSSKLSCDRCDVELNSCKALREHTKRHLDDAWYNCNQCSKTFMSQVSLHQHVCGKHGAGFNCCKCSQRLDSLSQRSCHEKQCKSWAMPLVSQTIFCLS